MPASWIDDAHFQEGLGTSFLAVGGAVVTDGVLLLDQPRTVVRRRLLEVAVGPLTFQF